MIGMEPDKVCPELSNVEGSGPLTEKQSEQIRNSQVCHAI